jgi:hypothetical protein
MGSGSKCKIKDKIKVKKQITSILNLIPSREIKISLKKHTIIKLIFYFSIKQVLKLVFYLIKKNQIY